MRDRLRWVLSASFWLALTVAFSPANASSTDWRLAGQLGGSSQAVAVQGNRLLVGIGPKLMTLDVTAPGDPLRLGATPPFKDDVQDIAVAGSLVYVAAGAAGMGIVSLADPSRPAVLGTWDSRGYAEGVAVVGTTVYLADGPDGLRILDVTDPARIAELGSAFVFNHAFGVVVAGRYAYIAAGGAGLLIADVTDPRQPLEVGRYDTPGYAYGLALIGNTAYVADAWGGIQAIDVSIPAQPVFLGSYATPGWAQGVVAVGTTLYVASGVNGVRLVDASLGAAMSEIGAYTGGGFARRVAAAASTFYVANTFQGVEVIGAGNSVQPVKSGGYSEIADARWVAVAEGYAYVAGGRSGNMAVVDISDPTNPRQVSTFQGDGYASGIVINGNYAYLTMYETHLNYLWIIDVTNPLHPLQAATISTTALGLKSGAPKGLAVQDGYMYVADEVGLSVFDISVAANVRNVAQFQLNSGGQDVVGVAVSGRHAYVAGAMNGVHIVDVNVPSAPILIGNFLTSGFSQAVAASGNRLYAGNGDGTVQVVDVSDPARPLELGRYRTPGAVSGLAVAGNQLFVSDGGGGIQILDISNPASVTLLKSLDTSGEARQAVTSGNILYVADGSGGLMTFQDRSAAGRPPSWRKTSSTGGNNPSFPIALRGSARLHRVSAPPSNVAAALRDVVNVTSAATCTVTTAADSGSGSLRECLANAGAGLTISFSPSVFPPTAPATISLQSALPILATGSITLDASNAGVIVDGNNSIRYGFEIASSYNRLMGLQIANFREAGVMLNSPSNSSRFNRIGGDRSVGIGPSGQGNVFNGNNSAGILIQNASNNSVTGNMLGTDARGIVAKGNYKGIMLIMGAMHNRIGGPAPGEWNVISGNTSHGVSFISTPNSWNFVAGNYIGTDSSGMKAIPNGGNGVMLEGGATNNTVGGASLAERNIVSGNVMVGVGIADSRTMQNSIVGNYIGTNAAGAAALPNSDGIYVWGPGFNRIGGTIRGEGNLISGNQWSGVAVGGTTARDVIIVGNAIGTDASGSPALGNGKGVDFNEGVKHNFVGGAAGDDGNVIRGNGFGVTISQAGTKYNSVAGNIITNNSSAGIIFQEYASSNHVAINTIVDNNPGVTVSQASFNTLRANAVTGNRTGGIQLGAGGNQTLTAPMISFSNSTRRVWGTACAACLIDIFSDSGDQGAVYEGSAVADSSGVFSFPMGATMNGPNVTATATDSQGNTSGFSTPQTGVTVPPFVSQSECLFHWAEQSYPTLLAPAGGSSKPSAPYYYRYYAQTGALLGTSSADNHLYYFGPLSSNVLVDLGALSMWATTANCK